MTAKATATRAEAIASAVALYAGEKSLDSWTDHEYTRGILEVLADTFGADVEDGDQAKGAIWEEMRAEHARIELRAEAERIARGLIFHNGQAPGCSDAYQAATERGETPAADMLELFTAAVLAGMEAGRSQHRIPFDALDHMLNAWDSYVGDVSRFMEAWLGHFNEGTGVPEWAKA